MVFPCSFFPDKEYSQTTHTISHFEMLLLALVIVAVVVAAAVVSFWIAAGALFPKRLSRIVALWTRRDVKAWLVKKKVNNAVVRELYGRNVDGLQLMSLFFMHRRGDWSWWADTNILLPVQVAAKQVTRACEKLESCSWVICEDVGTDVKVSFLQTHNLSCIMYHISCIFVQECRYERYR